MMLRPKHLRFLCAALTTASFAAPGHAQQDNTPKGVNPRDNITKVDLIYRNEASAGGVRVNAMALKFDRALTAEVGANIEIPIVRLSSPGATDSGLGDTEMRLRYVKNDGAISWIAAAEVVTPTASSDLLGSGKWQLNPGFGAVYAVSKTTFVYAGYKHLMSVGGDSARPDINRSQPRVLAAITSPRGWWVLGDLKFTRDHKAGTDGLDIEAEAGRMLTRDIGVSARIGTSALDSPRNRMLSLNLRHLF